MKDGFQILNLKDLSVKNKLIFFLLCSLLFHCGFAQNPTFTWDVATLDLGRRDPKLTALEADVLLELNKVRTNPAAYAEQYIQPRLKNFDKLIYDGNFATKEGTLVVLECVKELSQTKAMGPLSPEDKLFALAKKHSESQGKTKETGHSSPNGKTIKKRTRKLEKKGYAIGENISYGMNTGVEIVCQLLIDDGVRSRGHRKNILNPEYVYCGISFGPHLKYNYMCTIDFAFMRK